MDLTTTIYHSYAEISKPSSSVNVLSSAIFLTKATYLCILFSGNASSSLVSYGYTYYTYITCKNKCENVLVLFDKFQF